MPLNFPNTIAGRFLVLLFSVTLLTGSVASASEEDEIESKIAEIREEREQKAADAAAAAAKINLLEAENEDVKAALDAIVASVDAQQARVDAAEVDLANARGLVQASAEQEKQIRREIRKAEKNATRFAVDAYTGTSGAAQVWFETSDLSRSVRKVSYLDVVNQDRDDSFDTLRQLRADQQDVTAVAKAAKAEVKSISRLLERELEVLAERRATQERLQADVERRLAEWNLEFDHSLAADDELADQIRKLEAELDLIRNPPPPPSAAGWVWPASGPVTSTFGVRTHPIYGDDRMHNGIDIGAGTGAPVIAAAAGTVTFAGGNGNCGNTVMISHGGGLTSVYCHMSAIRTTVGAEVSAGNRVGDVGSTGASTGPHLHFEIRKGGAPVNPLEYL